MLTQNIGYYEKILISILDMNAKSQQQKYFLKLTMNRRSESVGLTELSLKSSHRLDYEV